jgi:hypothetical protein
MCCVLMDTLLQMTLVEHDPDLESILYPPDSHLMEEITAGKLLTHIYALAEAQSPLRTMTEKIKKVVLCFVGLKVERTM